MAKKVADVVIVCAVVLALDMAAGILGLLAQAAINKDKCGVKSNRFIVAAAVLLVVAELSANPFGSCDCICPQLKDIRASVRKRKLNSAIRWISWAVGIVGLLLLDTGTWTKWCGFLHGHAVAIGAILCFIHGGLIIAYYILAIAGSDEAPGVHH